TFTGYDKWNNELIGHPAIVGFLNSLHRIGVASAFALAFHHGSESFGLALPAAVAIHGVIAPADAGHFAAIFAHRLLQLLHVSGAASGQRIAPIHKGVNEDAFHSILLRHLEQGIKVVLVGVHAAIGEQAEKMQLAAIGAGMLHR